MLQPAGDPVNRSPRSAALAMLQAMSAARTALLLVALAVAPAAADTGITPPTGAPRPYTLDDHVPRAHDTRLTLEEWTVTARLDDGSVLLATLALSNLWFLPKTVALEASLIPARGQAVLFGDRADASGLRVDRDAQRVELSGRLWMEGLPPGPLRLHAESDWHDGLRVDLTLEDPWPGFVVGDGVYHIGDDPDARVQTMVVTPRARVKGTITQGDATREVTGTASVEHSYYAKLLSALFVQRHAVVAHLGDATMIAVAWQAREDRGGGTGGLLAAVTKKGLRAVTVRPRVAWDAPREVRGCREPGRWLYSDDDEGTLRLGGEARRRLQVFGLTDPMRALTRAAVEAVVGNPIFVRGTSRAEGQLGERRVKGKAIHRAECAARK